MVNSDTNMQVLLCSDEGRSHDHYFRSHDCKDIEIMSKYCVLPNSCLWVSNFIFVNTSNHCRPFSKSTIFLFVVPPKFCVSIFFFNFSWDLQLPQKKILKTMLMQNFEGTTKSIMVFFKKKACLTHKKKNKIKFEFKVLLMNTWRSKSNWGEIFLTYIDFVNFLCLLALIHE